MKCIVTRNHDGSLKFTAAESLPLLDRGEQLSWECNLETESSPAADAQNALDAASAEAEALKQAKKPPRAKK